MQSSDVEYWVDGVRMVGHMAVPDGDDLRPAVLVCHEGPGMTEHPRWRARRLAEELGYVAFALDYWGDGAPLPADQVPARLGALMADPLRTRALAEAGLQQLLAHPRADHPRVAAMGYCFGGTRSLELGRGGFPVHAIVGFHSGLANPQPGSATNITGRVLVCIGVDDPIKGREEAESAAYRRRLYNWWSTVLNTREEPGGIKLITHTRWSEADLIGWLLKQVDELDREGHGDAVEPWHVISMPIIAEPIIKPLPRLVTRETDDRLPGMALDPTRYDEEWARKKKLNTPDRDWEALYQQRPSAGEGTVFKASTFRYYVTEERMRDGEPSDLILPKHFIRRVCSVDCNFKDTPGTDMVAFTLWGQNEVGMWLLDMINQRLDFPATVDTIRAMAPVWKFDELLVEDKANGSAVISTFKREAINYLLHECNPIGGKEARANAASVEFKNGRVIFPRHAPWLPEYTGQLLKFPADDYDDLVDSTTQALNYVAGSGQMTVTTVAWGHSAEPVNDDDEEDF